MRQPRQTKDWSRLDSNQTGSSRQIPDVTDIRKTLNTTIGCCRGPSLVQIYAIETIELIRKIDVIRRAWDETGGP